MGKSAFLALLAVVVACDGNGLGNAAVENTVDTVMIGALVGTPISVPSAYGINPGIAGPIRTDQTSAFEFAYNILPDGRRVFLPRAALGLISNTAEPGVQPADDDFDDIE